VTRRAASKADEYIDALKSNIYTRADARALISAAGPARLRKAAKLRLSSKVSHSVSFIPQSAAPIRSI